MSSGTGVSLLDDIINISTQVGTLGTVGYGEKGVKKGVVTDAAIKGTKEITGAKAAEEANAMARDQFEKSTKAAEQARLDSIKVNERIQTATSNAATSTKSNSTNKTSSGKTASSITGDVTDFLGL